jgi:hypothetical protein
MLIIAYRSRSQQIAAAARLLALGWAFSVQLWIGMSGEAQNIAFVFLDIMLACAFLEMSRGNWFPIPLFILHALLVLHNLCTTFLNLNFVLFAIFVNRAFELAIVYVIVCAAYRIRVLRSKGWTGKGS